MQTLYFDTIYMFIILGVFTVKVHMVNLSGPAPLHPAIWYAPHYPSPVYTWNSDFPMFSQPWCI